MADDCTVVRFSTNDPSSARIETLKTSENGDKIIDQSLEFGLFYFICILLSICTYVLDYVFACWLLYYYSTTGQGLYFALTLTFVVLPAILMTAFSMRWYIVDHDNVHSDPTLGKPSVAKWVLRLILLICQLAPLLRYFDALSYGLRSQTCDNRNRQIKLYRRMVDEDTNGVLLRLFHCFLHAAPQAVIQLTILLYSAALFDKFNDTQTVIAVLQICAVITSLFSVAWSITSYHRSVRYARDDKEKITWQGTSIAFCWNLLSAVSRILALSLLASLRPTWMIAVCSLHWSVMSVWLALGHAHAAMCINRCEEMLLSVALGLVYVFAFIANRDGPTRYSYLAYYLVCFMENTGALVVWCVANNSVTTPFLYYGAVIGQVSAFLLSLVFMSLYYRCFHPASHRKCVDTEGPSTSTLDKPSYSKTYMHQCVANNSVTTPFLYYGAVIGQVSAFLLSLVFMSLYYRCFHPASHRKCVDTEGPSTSTLDKPSYSKTYMHQ